MPTRADIDRRPGDRPDGSCPHCPVRGRALTCPRHASGHLRFCEWVDPDSSSFHRRGAAEILTLAVRPIIPYLADPSEYAVETPTDPDPVQGLESPPLFERARNLVGAVGQAILSGGEQATLAEQARRLAICEGCEFHRDEQCLKCGCRLTLKVRLSAWHCPISKW